jgi:hypothetical protein
MGRARRRPTRGKKKALVDRLSRPGLWLMKIQYIVMKILYGVQAVALAIEQRILPVMLRTPST